MGYAFKLVETHEEPVLTPVMAEEEFQMTKRIRIAVIRAFECWSNYLPKSDNMKHVVASFRNEKYFELIQFCNANGRKCEPLTWNK